MGLHLDWEIETEQSSIKADGEDRASARGRRMARLRLLLGVLVILGLFGALYGVFIWRLRAVDGEIERALRDTIQAEVATLRIADRNGFLSVQRSASEDWIQAQSIAFTDYQRLLSEQDVQLTGEIVSLEVDGPRGRAQVQEIIDGVPYVRTWFYWRYAEEGWRHVPPDYTFWGASETTEQDTVTVRYRTLDAPVAAAVAEALSGWVWFTCETLTCGEVPQITVEILPDVGRAVAWSEADPWTLQMPSPYVGIARLDRPFDVTARVTAATLVAERLLAGASGVQPVYPADAAYLQEGVRGWLVGQYTSLDTGSHLIKSYAERYGGAAVGELVRTSGPTSDIRALNAPANVQSLHQLEVDWRDYLTWRLALENDLHQRRDQANFIALYNTAQPEIAGIAFNRYEAANPYETAEVVAVQPETTPTGTPALRAIAQVGEGESARQQEILFVLADDVWKRAN